MIPPPGIPLLILAVLPVFLVPGASHVPTHLSAFALALNFCLKSSPVVGCLSSSMSLSVTTIPLIGFLWCLVQFVSFVHYFFLSFPRLREGCHLCMFLWGIPSTYSKACSVLVGGRQEGEDGWLGGWLNRTDEWQVGE